MSESLLCKFDIDKHEIQPGEAFVVCDGYAYRNANYDCKRTVQAKFVREGPFYDNVSYRSKKRTNWLSPLRQQRKLKRAYRTEKTKISVGKFGIIIGRNPHIKSRWDVLVDGIKYALSSNYMKVLLTPEDIADVNKRLRNKPVKPQNELTK